MLKIVRLLCSLKPNFLPSSLPPFLFPFLSFFSWFLFFFFFLDFPLRISSTTVLNNHLRKSHIDSVLARNVFWTTNNRISNYRGINEFGVILLPLYKAWRPNTAGIALTSECTIWSVAGLTRTKRWKDKFVLCLSWSIHLLLPSDTSAPCSQVFGLRLNYATNFLGSLGCRSWDFSDSIDEVIIIINILTLSICILLVLFSGESW